MIVHGEFPESIWPQVIENELDEKRAKSSIKRLSYAQPSNRSLLEISIETGRKHQIRRHLIGIGFPVVGDRLYGNSEDQEDLLLVAASLAFHCPLSNQDVRYQAPVTLQL